jgi:hypothetical protein
MLRKQHQAFADLCAVAKNRHAAAKNRHAVRRNKHAEPAAREQRARPRHQATGTPGAQAMRSMISGVSGGRAPAGAIR